jgi:hypothetical protein
MLPLTSGNTTYLEREPIQIFFDQTLSRADKRSMLQVTEAQLKVLERTVQQVHKLALGRVELRACHVGEDRKTLEALRDFFGAKAVGAPTRQDAYSSMPAPFTGETNTWCVTTGHRGDHFHQDHRGPGDHHGRRSKVARWDAFG